MAEQIVWTSADGTDIDLTDESAGYSILANGTRGLRSVAYAFTTSSYAGVDGETVDAVKAVAGTPTLGLMMQATDEADFRRKARGLVRTMRPKAGIGTLTVRTETGEVRRLQCFCSGGLEGNEATDTVLSGAWWKLALKFYAPDPWWYGDVETMSFGLGPPTVFFPIFPLKLSASTVQSQFTVDLSDTDDPTPPVWTINGPGTSLTLTNQTTGQVIQVNAAIGSGEIMVIDTRPGHQSVRRGDGTNLMSAVASDPALWQLTDGVNQITAALTGATSESRITGAYRPRYSGI